MTDTTPLEPLGLDEVKANLRFTGTGQDDLIESLITDAREYVESQTGLVLVPRTITETTAQLGRWIDLASWPITNVIAIRSPINGTLTPLAGTAWQTSYKRRPVRIVPTAFGWGLNGGDHSPCYPSLPVEIDVAAGYATPDDVPRAATRAMHMLIAHWFINRPAAEVGVRAAAVEVPFGVEKLLERLQITRV